MDVAELIARESIRDLVARYNSTADSGRFDETVALFAPDAVMQIGDQRYQGIEAIRSIFTGTREQVTSHGGGRPAYWRHFTATLQIDLTSPTTARGRCYYAVVMAHGLDHWGRYLDEYGEIDGRWLFTARRATTDGSTPGGFVG
jgi:hypothetical protein